MATLNPEMSIQGSEKAGDIIDVLSEVKPEDTADKVNHININTDEIDTTELRVQLFKTYMICNDKETYEALNVKIKELHNYLQLVLQTKSLELRASVFRQCEEWLSIQRSFR